MADRHTKNPITFRPGQQDRGWLEDYAQLHGMSERSVLGQALASFRMSTDKGWNVAQLLEYLTVILSALDIPYAASTGDDEKRQMIINMRVMITLCNLKSVLERGKAEDLKWQIDYLREELAKHPATGYRTDYDEVMADSRGIPVEQYKAEKAAAAASATETIRTEIEA